MGDVHIGNAQSHRAQFRTALRKAEKVILMGDLIEGFTKKDMRHSDDTILDYNDQIIEAKKDIKPYRKKIEFVLSGNHENSLLSKMGIDSMSLMFDELKIPCYDTTIKQLDGIDCFFTHGTGFPVTYGGIVTKMINLSKDHAAEYYFMGHTHKLFDILAQHNPNPFTIVNTGTFLNQCEYARKMAFPKPVLGYYVLDTELKTVEKVVLK